MREGSRTCGQTGWSFLKISVEAGVFQRAVKERSQKSKRRALGLAFALKRVKLKTGAEIPLSC